jgi:hypothetical protein
MIRCWTHRNEIRRHLNEGAAIPETTREHLTTCANCREILEAHNSVQNALTRERPAHIELPFLRARILNALQPQPSRTREASWSACTLRRFGIAVTLVFVTLLTLQKGNENSPQPQVQTIPPTWELPKLASAQIEIPNSLESELEFLKSDTQRAARALAASFMPSER